MVKDHVLSEDLHISYLQAFYRNQNLTLSQNYHHLGLTSKLNAHTGGVERLGSQVEDDPKAVMQGKDRLSVASKVPTSIMPSEARIERDPSTGVILKVIHSQHTIPNPLLDPLNNILDTRDEDSLRVHLAGGIIPELEEQALMEIKKRPRQQSKREGDWISELVQKYGDDYSCMTRDRKLNPYQQSEGDLRPRVRIWKERKK